MPSWSPSAHPPAWLVPILLALVVGLGVALGVLLWQRGTLLRSLARLRASLTGAASVGGLLSVDQVAQALDDAVQRCDRSAGTLCLLLINLDNLQAVNDGYGHQQADLLIADATRRLQRLAGPDARLARLGGV